MKKIFKISLVSLLAVMPMVAGAEPVAAEPVAGEPVAGDSNSPTAISAPKYALAPANSESDNTVATAGYVKGAYNAIIKGINKTQEGVDTLNADITTNKNTIDHLLDGKATQTGTVATIKNASTTESIKTSKVEFAKVTTTSISATASGDVNLSVTMMSDWGNDAAAASPVTATTSFSDLPVDELTMSAPDRFSHNVTLTESGINGTVNVAKYLAKAVFNFTKLINVKGNDRAYIREDGTKTYGNTSGLSNGEWKITWNDYGTVRGTTMCSTTRGSSRGETGTPDNDNGKYCWCKVTGWTPKGGTETPATSLWVFDYKQLSAADCAIDCANLCSYDIGLSDSSEWRSGIFSNAQQI